MPTNQSLSADFWVYAALSEHIYRRDSTKDQALRGVDIAAALGLAEDELFPPLNAEQINALTAIGLVIDQSRYVYNPNNGFEAALAFYNGKWVVVFRGTDTIYSIDQAVQDIEDGASKQVGCIKRSAMHHNICNNRWRRMVDYGFA
ncbi:MAG: hypothetical protein R3C60_02080 [Parvularculaceae bacterium]